MTTKKHKKQATERHPVTLRFNDQEMANLQTDRREVNGTGVPASFGAYAKHAVLNYPRLRKLEAALKRSSDADPLPQCRAFADAVLRGAL